MCIYGHLADFNCCGDEAKAMRATQKPKQQRKMSLVRALKHAAKAGQSVKSACLYRDHIVLQFDAPDSAETQKDTPEGIIKQL
jgi:hypothetical protein